MQRNKKFLPHHILRLVCWDSRLLASRSLEIGLLLLVLFNRLVRCASCRTHDGDGSLLGLRPTDTAGAEVTDDEVMVSVEEER